MQERLERWRQYWHRTTPIDPGQAHQAIEELFVAAGIPRPRIRIAASPRAMVLEAACELARRWLASGMLIPMNIPGFFESTDIGRVARSSYKPLIELPTWNPDSDSDAPPQSREIQRIHSELACVTAAPCPGRTLEPIMRNEATHDELWENPCYDTARQEFGESVSLVRCGMWRCSQFIRAAPRRNELLYLFAALDGRLRPLPTEDLRLLAAWETAALATGPCWIDPGQYIASDFPEVQRFDALGRRHCENGPALAWRDGWSQYFWHGTPVPREVIELPDTITVTRIDGEQNSEVQRVLLERFGIARYIEETRAALVHSLPEDYPVKGLRSARLYRRSFVDDRSELYAVAVRNSTPELDGSFKDYLLRVNPLAYEAEASRHCHAAVASTWRNADGTLVFDRWQDYAPGFES